MWLARDLTRELWLYTHKPVRVDDCWRLPNLPPDAPADMLSFFEDWFPGLDWEDEPVEIEFKRGLQNSSLWAARDQDGEIWVYSRKPDRCTECWDLEDKSPEDNMAEIYMGLFPDLKWEDEPIEVEIVRKPKIQKKKCG